MSKSYTALRGEKLRKKGRKGLFKLLFSRTGLVAAVLLLNIGLLVGLVLRFRDYLVPYVGITTALSIVLMHETLLSRPGIFIALELHVYSFSERNSYGGEPPCKVRGVGESIKQTLVLGLD